MINVYFSGKDQVARYTSSFFAPYDQIWMFEHVY